MNYQTAHSSKPQGSSCVLEKVVYKVVLVGNIEHTVCDRYVLAHRTLKAEQAYNHKDITKYHKSHNCCYASIGLDAFHSTKHSCWHYAPETQN